MKKRIGYLNNTKTKSTNSNKSHLTIPSGGHGMVIGTTGAGKTQLLKNMLTRKIGSGESVVIIDEKAVLGSELKAMFKDSKIKIYELGSGGGDGTQAITINLHALTCSSKLQSRNFFNALIADDYEKSEGHKFWGQGGSKSGYRINLFMYTLHKLLFIMKTREDDIVEFRKTYAIEYAKKSTDHEFYVSSEPMTFKAMEASLTDFHIYRIISERGYEIIEKMEYRLKDRFSDSELTEQTAKEIDKLLSELQKVSQELSRMRVHENPGEASSTNGLLMTLRSSLPITLFENDVLNDAHPKLDLFKVLEEEQSIVILNHFNKETIQILFNVISDYLSMRSHKNNVHPVTMVLEELPRYITPSLDLESTLAYARESRYSIIGAIQDISQLNKFSDGEIDSILNNTKIFQMDTKDSPLDKFQYRYENDPKVYSFTPNFIDKADALKASLEYQQKTKQFIKVDKSSSEVVIYDEHLYQAKGLLTLIDTESMSERTVSYTMDSDIVDGYFMQEYRDRLGLDNEEDDMFSLFDMFEDDENIKAEKDMK